MEPTNKPIAVVIADVHYDLNTLELADTATNQAIKTANEMDIPLIVAGDLHNSKANLRGECANAMIKTFQKCTQKPYIIIGNHDLINEKAKEHSLNFLRPYANIIDSPKYIEPFGYMIPYQSNTDDLVELLQEIPEGSKIIMHQGIQNSNSGEYYVDKTALPSACFDGLTVVSGHYHARQTIKCGKTGIFTYVGNPYTLTYGECGDPEKGYQVLWSDGTLTHIPTNLRKHVIWELEAKDMGTTMFGNYAPSDLLWVKVVGTYEELSKHNRLSIAKALSLTDTGWKLDLLVNDPETKGKVFVGSQTQGEILDTIIDSSQISGEQKERLKELWRKSSSN